MRVISGSARGRRLKELQGMDTRPTTDKVKESLFNIIQFEIEGRRVLDLFGGTGQLGIEALSRGADHCTFVDMRKEAAALIRENLRLTGLSERSRVVQGDALSFLSSCGEKFDVILSSIHILKFPWGVHLDSLTPFPTGLQDSPSTPVAGEIQ